MTRRVTVLTGGVGGAKLVLGLTHVAPAVDLTAIVNTGDDFRHFGLHVSPDIDTLLYTLSGKANQSRGWGREGETWNFMAALRSLGGADWFALGDGDLALHIWRTAQLAAGEGLDSVTNAAARMWGIGARILPMSNAPVRTMVDSDIGELEFQQYFVQHRCVPRVRGIRFEGAAAADPAPGVIAALHDADMIVLAPSNPWLSMDPILAVPGIRAAIHAAGCPVVAVSPLVGGAAVKGPTAKLMAELGMEVSNAAIAAQYAGLIDGLLVHKGDTPPAPSVQVREADIWMRSLADRVRVADATLLLAGEIGRP